MRSPALRTASRRVAALRALVLLAFLGLSARAAQLTVDPRAWQHGEGQAHALLKLAPARGLIVDRHGVELAITTRAPSIYVVPSQLDDPRESLRSLARALGVERDALAARIAGRERFTYVARWITEEQARRVEALSLSGVGLVEEPRRAYPAGSLAAALLGFADIDGKGVRGIEQQEDGWLRGSALHAPVERDARGRLLVDHGIEPLAAAGGDVALTLDATMQAAAETALREAVAGSGARGGLALTLDPRDGAILALAEMPGFDPNHFREVPYAETRSRAFLDALEPGSTFKIFLVAAALEAGVVEADEQIDCGEGSLRVPGKTIRDAHAHGLLDPGGVLRVSSNVGAVQLAQRLGPQRHHLALRRFGFGLGTGSGFPFESAGLLRDWREWQPLDHATIAFGQGVDVTAIQLAAATAALADGGELQRPRLVAARRRAGRPWRATEPERVRRAVSPETAARVLAMMESVVGSEGTGRLAGLAGVRVAGKTGTAQKLDRETGTYANDRFIAWFLGVVPADDPKLVLVVALDEPDGPAHTGGAVAAPLFARIAAAQLGRLGVSTEPAPLPPSPHRGDEERTTTPTHVVAAHGDAGGEAGADAEPDPEGEESGHGAGPRPAPRRPLQIARVGDRMLLPDFRGSTIADVKQVTDASGIELEILGRGVAVEQDPVPGTILSGAGGRVRVRFASEPGQRDG